MTEDSPQPAWEPVHTIHDWWDGPRKGVADYGGVPHAYACEWDVEKDERDLVFRLSPITSDQSLKVMESWEIWRRWREAHDAGALGPADDHPALTVDRSRYEELKLHVDEAMTVADPPAVLATAEFRAPVDSTHFLEVRWFPLETAA